MSTPYRSYDAASPPPRYFITWPRTLTLAGAGVLAVMFTTTFRYCEKQPSSREALEIEATRYMQAMYPGHPVRVACRVLPRETDVCSLLVDDRIVMINCEPNEGCSAKLVLKVPQ